MRRHGPPSEVARLVAPLARAVDAVWQRMHWWIGTMAVLYAFSGITIVRPDEVAVVLRWGRLVGDRPALQQHSAGLLFAFPRPIDQVIRVQTKKVWEVRVSTLTGGGPGAPAETNPDEDEPPVDITQSSLDPITQGYAVTGDHNIVQVETIARYRVREPSVWRFYGPPSEDILRVEVSAAIVRSVGEMGVDRVLSDGRKELIATAARRAQEGLDSASSGLELTSLEVTQLGPPVALAADFSAVQSAFIEAETKRKDAQAFAETAVPQANSDVDAQLQAARADGETQLATARGESDAFKALAREYRANPDVVRERLYRDAVERAISVTSVRWLPPPVGGQYHGFRITVGPRGAGQRFGPTEPDER